MKITCIQQSYQVPLHTYPRKTLTTFKPSYKEPASNSRLIMIRINEKRKGFFSKIVRLISNIWGAVKLFWFPKDQTCHDLSFEVQLLLNSNKRRTKLKNENIYTVALYVY